MGNPVHPSLKALTYARDAIRIGEMGKRCFTNIGDMVSLCIVVCRKLATS
jgi:hypothetical protein